MKKNEDKLIYTAYHEASHALFVLINPKEFIFNGTKLQKTYYKPVSDFGYSEPNNEYGTKIHLAGKIGENLFLDIDSKKKLKKL